MDKHSWIATRAYFLWEKANRPPGRDLEFHLQSERDFQSWQLCILNPGTCPHQEVVPLSGGRHICVCHDTRECGHRAFDHNYAH